MAHGRTRRSFVTSLTAASLAARAGQIETVSVAHASEVGEIKVVQNKAYGDRYFGYYIKSSGEFAERVTADGTMEVIVTDDDGAVIARREKDVSGMEFSFRVLLGPFSATPRMVEYRVRD